MYPVPNVFAVRKLEKLCKYPFFLWKKGYLVIYQADLWLESILSKGEKLKPVLTDFDVGIVEKTGKMFQ